MTERGAKAVQRDRTSLSIGPSVMSWDGAKIDVVFDEVTMPWGYRTRGSIALYPTLMPTTTWTLAEHGDHCWTPLAPIARVVVNLTEPELKWSGSAYLDHNSGAAPLEDAVTRWHWSRASHRHDTVALYDAQLRDGSLRSLALRYTAAGNAEQVAPPRIAPLPATRWRIARETRADAGNATVVRTLEDTPFYARSLVATRLLGNDMLAMHESLSLSRFRSPLVQWMLPFRMPRRPD